jgi:DNA (cytosine-5)-methyltransferase 1
MTALRLLDLFCGAGGAAMGYHRAGFEVVGVDMKPQKHYPFEFHCADAFAFLEQHGHEFDAIHASPPCQAYSTVSSNEKEYPDLYAGIRTQLEALSKPWVMENVIGAPYRWGTVLCGSMFGMVVRRHRNFETSWLILSPLRCDHAGPRPKTVTGKSGGVAKHSDKGVREEWPTYMQMPWATPDECTQAIPPAYTEWLGKRLLEALR